jgi:2-amino-4-hydroxy-6-hydroxymethyldihydropteridine diphosphokinase
MDPAPRNRSRRATACIALGSNLGDRDAHLAAALAALRRNPGIEVVAVSAVFETDPVGPPPQGVYLNAAVRVETELPPRELLGCLQEIEASRGRRRSGERWAARPLDLDLLLYDEACIDEPGLVVPHPRMHERAFVLAPLCEVAAAWRHPLLGLSIDELAKGVADPTGVRRRADF